MEEENCTPISEFIKVNVDHEIYKTKCYDEYYSDGRTERFSDKFSDIGSRSRFNSEMELLFYRKFSTVSTDEEGLKILNETPKEVNLLEFVYHSLEKGFLNCLKYIIEIRDLPVNAYLISTCSISSRFGHLDCLEYLFGQLQWMDRWSYEFCSSCFCSHAAGGGHIDCLRYAHNNGFYWCVRTCAHAAGGGNIDCLKYAHENGLTPEEVVENETKGLHSCPWDEDTVIFAIENDKFDCFKYAIDNGCPHFGLLEYAIKQEKIEHARYLIEISKEFTSSEKDMIGIFNSMQNIGREAIIEEFGKDIGNLVLSFLLLKAHKDKDEMI
jgi:hypothetical protein